MQLKAKEKRWVFSKVLKTPIDWADLMWRGRLFQSRGAVAVKERSPLLFLNLVIGTSSKDLSADLRALAGPTVPKLDRLSRGP